MILLILNCLISHPVNVNGRPLAGGLLSIFGDIQSFCLYFDAKKLKVVFFDFTWLNMFIYSIKQEIAHVYYYWCALVVGS